ncbi:MAG: hypothetical protein ACO3N9_08930 [Alphaproteobacteria bacterium]
MIRVLLLTVVPFFLPTVAYVLWRVFLPVRFGGSAAIDRDEWEPLPWKWLVLVGGFSVVVAISISIIFPDLLAHSGSVNKN